MKKSLRLYLTGSFQTMFFDNFIKESAEKIGVKGFMRRLEDGRIEIFIEGDLQKVDEMIALCKQGHQHTQIRKVEEKLERFQDFKNFKILKI